LTEADRSIVSDSENLSIFKWNKGRKTGPPECAAHIALSSEEGDR